MKICKNEKNLNRKILKEWRHLWTSPFMHRLKIVWVYRRIIFQWFFPMLSAFVYSFFYYYFSIRYQIDGKCILLFFPFFKNIFTIKLRENYYYALLNFHQLKLRVEKREFLRNKGKFLENHKKRKLRLIRLLIKLKIREYWVFSFIENYE